MFILAVSGLDATDAQQGMEYRKTRLNLLGMVIRQRFHYLRIFLIKALRGPDDERHMKLVIRCLRCCMEEEIPIVIKDILAMVTGIEHRRGRLTIYAIRLIPSLSLNQLPFLQSLHNPMQDLIGISDGMIVGIQQVTPVLRHCLTPAIRLEVSKAAGITLLIIEVGTIGMKYHEELAITVMG